MCTVYYIPTIYWLWLASLKPNVHRHPVTLPSHYFANSTPTLLYTTPHTPQILAPTTPQLLYRAAQTSIPQLQPLFIQLTLLPNCQWLFYSTSCDDVIITSLLHNTHLLQTHSVSQQSSCCVVQSVYSAVGWSCQHLKAMLCCITVCHATSQCVMLCHNVSCYVTT